MSLFNLGPKLPAGVTKAKIEDKSHITQEPDVDGIQIMANDGVNICSNACAVCWDSKIPDDYQGRSTYISKRTAIGHSSVTEHSNNVFYLTLNRNNMQDIIEVLSVNRYLHTCVRFSSKYDYIYMIIGGSWRAWNYLVSKFMDMSMSTGHVNIVFSRLMSGVYSFCDWSGFADLIKDKVLIANRFANADLTDLYNNTVSLGNKKNSTGPVVISNKVECYGLDNINKIVSMLSNNCPEPELFSIADMLKFCTCTILFKNMSRTGTHQLVRHRNAITQESQRYVDYSTACFNSPAKFKDIYDPDYKYTITFGRSSQKMNLQEIGDNIAKIYGQLVDKTKLGKLALLKEDARSYLPSSVQCQKIFITFTWDYLFKFLKLREDKHAQAEIRGYAIDIGNWFAEQYPEFACAYRSDAGDVNWMKFNIPSNKVNDDSPMDKESFIEVIENSMKTETINTDSKESEEN